ncbi:unnamed protein product [Closterium sp. NIES-64]|nr:unnamed protein product [Closterium sp. NIES-64]
MEHSSAFDAVMADTDRLNPSISEFLADGPAAKRPCVPATSSSSKPPTPPRSSPSPPPATGGEVSSAPSQSNTARRYRRLVAQRDTVGETVDSVNRDLDSLTTLIFPENLAEFRKALGQSAAIMKLKSDPGIFFISLETEAEAWTCAACNFTCGWTTDTALAHVETQQHQTRALQATRPTLKEEFGDQKITAFLKNDTIKSFLSEE